MNDKAAYDRKYRVEHPEQVLINAARYRARHRGKIRKRARVWQIKNNLKFPWKRFAKKAKSRCNNPNNEYYSRYGGRGIKYSLTFSDLKVIWFRDKAYKMRNPSIDRINNDGNYTFKNCQFLELEENTRKQWLDRRGIKWI